LSESPSQSPSLSQSPSHSQSPSLSASPSEPPIDGSDSGGLGAGSIAAIVIGTIALVLGSVILAILFIRRYRSAESRESLECKESDNEGETMTITDEPPEKPKEFKLRIDDKEKDFSFESEADSYKTIKSK
jgi:hypothetical protein